MTSSDLSLNDPLDLSQLQNFTAVTNSGFEASALQSCLLRYNGVVSGFDFPFVTTLSYVGFAISTSAALLIFSVRRNRSAYPQNFLGLICLFESSFYHMEIIKFSDICTDLSYLRASLRNTMFLKGSWTSSLLGWYWLDLNEVQLAGILQVTTASLLDLTISTELMISVALNLDMALTLKDSFNRGRNLMMILLFVKVTFAAYFIH